ncbi:glycosyltransferase family 4 protein [candidate division KSB1 bacterium]|nr:glycosyltransferase family 4 protein [candidate division KSB1 bacterium]
MENSKINVLHVIDKLSMDGTNPSSCTKLFVDWMPKFDADKFNVKVCTLRDPDPAGKVLEDIGVDVFYINKGKISPANITEIETLIQKHKIDIVHLHGYSAANFGRIAARRQGIKNVVHEHAILKVQPHQYVADWLLRNKTDAAIAVSGAVKDFMMSGRHVPENTIRVIENGIDIEKFAAPSREVIENARKQYGIPDGQKVIGTLTRFREEKGNLYLIEAMQDIFKQHPDTVCVLFGDGPLRDELKQLVKTLNIEKHVLFPGFVNDIHTAYHLFDVMVIPSLSEGFGLVLVEAMASSRACVATKIGGMVDILDDGTTGFFVPPKDAVAIAVQVNKLLADDTLRDSLGRAAKLASEKYTMQHNVDALMELYQGLMYRS